MVEGDLHYTAQVLESCKNKRGCLVVLLLVMLRRFYVAYLRDKAKSFKATPLILA